MRHQFRLIAGGALALAALAAGAMLLGLSDFVEDILGGEQESNGVATNRVPQHGLITGFDDDAVYLSGDSAERRKWLDRTMQSGAGFVRVSLVWAQVAAGKRPPDPSNPASSSYSFERTDAFVRDARARGLKVMLMVYRAPPWAEAPDPPPGAGPGSWKPRPGDLADFLRAVAARYTGEFDPDGSGPASALPPVQALQVWNEPNHPYYLGPQYHGQDPASPARYREMLNLAYSAIKEVNPKLLVVAAALTPYGDDPGGERVRPVPFWRDVFCVQETDGGDGGPSTQFERAEGCDGETMFDVLAHHPINTSGGPLWPSLSPEDASSAHLDRIVRVLRGAESAGTVSPGKHPIWASEIWWDANPPNPDGAPLGVQARWLEYEFFLVWRAGASVALNFLIRDYEQVFGADQSGIYFADGRPKPALTAFRFPFVTTRIDSETLLAWGKAPAGGKLVIERRQGGRWLRVDQLKVRQGAVFTAELPLSGTQRLRATVSGNESLVWHEPDPTLRKPLPWGCGKPSLPCRAM